MSDELVFEEPPPMAGGRWLDRVALMAEHPGEWVNVGESFGLKISSGAAAHGNAAKKAAEKLGLKIEVRSYRANYPDCVVYMRVVKEEA